MFFIINYFNREESLTSSGNYVTSGKDYEVLPKKLTR